MKKIAIYSIFSIIILIMISLLTPFVAGFIIEKKYPHIVATLASNTKTDIKMIDYRRGWFNSTAKLLVTVPTDLISNFEAHPLTPPIAFMLNQHIHHGFIIVSRSNEGKKKVKMAQAIIDSSLTNSNMQLFAKTFIKINGDIHLTIHSPSLHYTIPEQQKSEVAVENLEANINLTQNFSHFSTQLHLTSFNLVSQIIHQQLNDVTINYQLQKTPYHFWTGDRYLHIGQFDWNTSHHEQFSVQNLNTLVKNILQQGKVNEELTTDIAAFYVNGINYSNQRFHLNINDMNAEALQKLNQLQNIPTNDETSLQVAEMLSQHIETLLSKGIGIHLVELNLNTAWGKITGGGDIIFPYQNPPLNIIDKMEGKLHLQMPKSFTHLLNEKIYDFLQNHSSHIATQPIQKLAEQNMNAWIKKGWVQSDGNDYKINIECKQEQVWINGESLQVQPSFLLFSLISTIDR